jgi:hypothetical protein
MYIFYVIFLVLKKTLAAQCPTLAKNPRFATDSTYPFVRLYLLVCVTILVLTRVFNCTRVLCATVPVCMIPAGVLIMVHGRVRTRAAKCRFVVVQFSFRKC